MKSEMISVIMPARNCAGTIEVAVESIVQQTYPRLELIIVEDNSTDRSRDLVYALADRHDNVKGYTLPLDDPHRFGWNGQNINAGWAARNFGMERANGAWITFQDADDASLLNRLDVQYDYAKKYGSSHVCLDWQRFDEAHVSKYLDIKGITSLHGEERPVLVAGEILEIAAACKGIIPKYLPWLHERVPHEWKLRKFVHRFFFKDLSPPYPGAANSCLVRRDVYPTVRFRSLQSRVWPSRRGRGADRDFNFAVTELVRNSITVRLPAYLWRVSTHNPEYLGEEYVPVKSLTK